MQLKLRGVNYKKNNKIRRMEIGDSLAVSAICSHVEVRDTGAVGTSFLTVSLPVKSKGEATGKGLRIMALECYM